MVVTKKAYNCPYCGQLTIKRASRVVPVKCDNCGGVANYAWDCVPDQGEDILGCMEFAFPYEEEGVRDFLKDFITEKLRWHCTDSGVQPVRRSLDSDGETIYWSSTEVAGEILCFARSGVYIQVLLAEVLKNGWKLEMVCSNGMKCFFRILTP